MKILYHHRTLADGAEGVHIAEMVQAFRELGHEVRVLGLAAGTRGESRRGWIAGLRRLCPGVVFELAAILTNVLEYFHTRNAIRDFKPDLLYKRHARFDVGAMLAASRAGVHSVLEVNCLFTAPGYRNFEPIALERAARWLEREALRLATRVIAVSSPLAAQVNTLSGLRATIVPNGADPERFDPGRTSPDRIRTLYGLSDGLVVGWTGVLREWHGLDLLLEAVAGLPGSQLLIVGDGPARAALESRVESLGLTRRVTITGRVPHAEVPDHVAAMDIAVVAADSTGVASPMKLLEYMAMARPVVAPSLPNMADVVVHGITGWLFTLGDAAALQRAVVTLASDPGLRRRLGAAARRAVVEKRNWKRIAADLLALARDGADHPGSAEPSPTENATLLVESGTDENTGQASRP